MEKVSIIVPVYNAEKTVNKTLASLISQTYENIEIIAIDDGSADSSYDILVSAAASDSRIRVFHIENSGVSFARNFGISVSSGEFIMFIDSDDEYIPTAVETMADAAVMNGADIVSAGICRVKGQSVYSVSNPPHFTDKFAPSFKEELLKEMCRGQNEALCSFVSKMYSSKLLKEKNIKFPPIVSGEDTVFAFEAAVCSEKVFILDNFPFYMYIENPVSFTKKSIPMKRRMEYSTAFFSEMEKVIEKYGLYSMKEPLFARKALSVYDFAMGAVSDATLPKKEKLETLRFICGSDYCSKKQEGEYFEAYSRRVKAVARAAECGNVGRLYIFCRFIQAGKSFLRRFKR